MEARFGRAERTLLTVLTCLALAGCARAPDPATDRAFWRDAALVQAELGVEAVAIPAGEPLWDFPLLVVTRDELRFDDRPWRAGLAPEVRDALERAPSSFVLPLTDGAVSEEQLRGVFVSPLYDEVKAAVDDHKAAWAATGSSWAEERWQGVNILAEEDVPFATLGQLVYTSAQAQLAAPVFVGRAGGELRGAHAGRPEPWYRAECAGRTFLLMQPEGAELVLVDRQVLDVSSDGALTGLATDLARGCAPRWERRHAELLAAKPDGLVEPAAWRCVSVTPFVGGKVPAGRVLRLLGSTWDLAPDVHMPNPMVAMPADQPLGGATVPSLEQVDLDAACETDRLEHTAYGDTGVKALLGTVGSSSRADAVRDLLDDAALQAELPQGTLRSTADAAPEPPEASPEPSPSTDGGAP